MSSILECDSCFAACRFPQRSGVSRYSGIHDLWTILAVENQRIIGIPWTVHPLHSSFTVSANLKFLRDPLGLADLHRFGVGLLNSEDICLTHPPSGMVRSTGVCTPVASGDVALVPLGLSVSPQFDNGAGTAIGQELELGSRQTNSSKTIHHIPFV